MSYIDLTSSTYSNLNQMAVYAQGTLTANTTGSDPIAVYGGDWAGYINKSIIVELVELL